MKYISTRGQAASLSFEEVVLTGLASDGGLYVPESLPKFSHNQMQQWAGLNYQELMLQVIHPFVGDNIASEDLIAIIEKSYAGFRHEAIAPLVQLERNQWVLELFHGPTLAFKDFALQFLGNILDYYLKRRNERAVIMGATSGDTGSAAIDACKACSNIDIFILHPHNRVSDVQRRQMTSVIADNVHNIALQGNFDDCQNMVKRSFQQQSFLPDGRRLVAVNSINWARIMAQIVYYFYAAIALGAPHRKVSFSVPTGNFGDIFAGYLAKKMGLPIDTLVVATNQNDILHRCIQYNDYRLDTLHHSISPSMDIMVSSNFERLLFDLYQNDSEAIKALMGDLQSGKLQLSEPSLRALQNEFDSFRADDALTMQAIVEQYKKSAYLLDPHSAIGVQAARQTASKDVPMISLATAHPAKFPQAIKQAQSTFECELEEPQLPHAMRDIFAREERYQILENNLDKVHAYMQEKIQ